MPTSPSFSLNNPEKGFVAITAILVGILVLVVGGALFYFSKQRVADSLPPQSNSPSSIPKEVPKEAGPSATVKPNSSTDPNFSQLKKDILNSVDQKIATFSGNPSAHSPKEIFVYFGVNGSSSSITWIDLAGSDIKFNTVNYPGATAFYFLSDLQTDAPDRVGYARIYDVTHSAGVAGSDINYHGLDPSFKQSSAMSFSSGDLQLRVQVHSELNNTLIYNPRIKIVY